MSSNAYNEYLVAFERGRRLCRLLDSFSEEKKEQCAAMHSLYSVESDLLRPNATKDVRQAVSASGVNISELVYVEVRTADNFERGDAAYTNYVDAKSGVVVCSENYKNRDENAPHQKLWPSEILWESWMMVAKSKGSRRSDIQVIVRYWVMNEPTKSIIWHAARLSTCTRIGQYDHREYTKADQGYHAILGSVNGGSTMRMLLDHKAHMGYRTVERVVVLGDKTLTLAKPECRSFVLFLSPRRIPPTKIPQLPSTTRKMIHLKRWSSGNDRNIRLNRSTKSDPGHSNNRS